MIPFVLQVAAVEKRYALGETRVDVLRGISFNVSAGEVCAVMGPSGVGKSTLLSCIAGLDVPDAGKISVLDRDLTGLSDEGRTLERRKNIGIVYQFFNLVNNLTARENVSLPFLIDGQEPDAVLVDEALSRVGMTGRVNHFPAQLSGGEMQLVSIARAMVRKPALILADEPTGNVNVATGRKVMALLADVARETNAGMLLVTHNPEDAARADRVLFMTDGKIASELAGDVVTAARVLDHLKSLGI